MPSLEDLYMGASNRAGPYGPRNAPPPPVGSPPAAPQHAGTGEHNRHLHQRRERELSQSGRRAPSPYYEAANQGRQPSLSPNYHDPRPEHRRYREPSPKRSRSSTSPRQLYESEGSRLARQSPSVRLDVEERYHSKRSSSPRWRSRSPRRDSHHYQYKVHDEYEGHEHSGARSEYVNRRRQRSLTPVPVRERRIRNTDIPETAYPLRAYTNYIADNHAAKRRSTSQNHHLPVFRNGDGKVNPSAYGSVLQYDFGLCYCTFRTMYMCEMGTRCPWRHHPLSAREKEWVKEIAREKGTHFIQEAEKSWATPEVPVPGHNMIEVMQQERDADRPR
ncbi:uncharacterized protein N0V89_009985 [Didymosphaeria variabile]|uniref:Uncharacterized protein n=1 Tax=Didymosphaeria variabile TaxID=1932322 RepID=A0A9W8XEI7_9PLEO|nr:uncharacterized protein N0V89_009985 [Didymosphaeria variabile]KAJ4348607.1 hypothetical protein N0V89_009985 [Didymosphaeria variabile]